MSRPIKTVDVNDIRPGYGEVTYVRTLENDPISATIVTILALAAVLLSIIAAFSYPKFVEGVPHIQTPFKVIVGLLGLVLILGFISFLWFIRRIPALRERILSGPVVAAVIEERTSLEVARQYGPAKQVPIFRYRYEWNGESFEGLVNCTNWKNKHSALRDLEVGDEIAVIIDTTNPARTFIRDYFWG